MQKISFLDELGAAVKVNPKTIFKQTQTTGKPAIRTTIAGTPVVIAQPPGKPAIVTPIQQLTPDQAKELDKNIENVTPGQTKVSTPVIIGGVIIGGMLLLAAFGVFKKKRKR